VGVQFHHRRRSEAGPRQRRARALHPDELRSSAEYDRRPASQPWISGTGFACFAADGKTLNFTTMPPAGSGIPFVAIDFDVAPDGMLIGAGNLVTGAPVTANAPQPTPAGPANGYLFEIRPENPTPQLNYVSPPLILPPQVAAVRRP